MEIGFDISQSNIIVTNYHVENMADENNFAETMLRSYFIIGQEIDFKTFAKMCNVFQKQMDSQFYWCGYYITDSNSGLQFRVNFEIQDEDENAVADCWVDFDIKITPKSVEENAYYSIEGTIENMGTK